MAQTVLISGASIAGPALAFWLRRYGFQPTIVERAKALRTGGYPIDVRGVAMQVVERMGLLAEVRAAHIATRQLRSVDRHGRPTVTMDLKALTGAGHDAELPRGVLAELLYRATQQDSEYLFADSISSLDQDEGGVHVSFRHGPPRRFDLVVGADGTHSQVRLLAFGDEAQFQRYLGFHFMGFTIPNTFGLDREVMIYNEPARMASIYAVRGQERLNVLLVFAAKEPLDSRLALSDQLACVRSAFAGAAGPLPELLSLMDGADDLYFDTVSQIRMPSWSAGRVSLVGDASYAPSFLSGQGTSLALVGAYQLARELFLAEGNHRIAFPAYERALRLFVDQNQALAVNAAGTLIPRSAVAIWLRDKLLNLVPLLLRLGLNPDRNIYRAANAFRLS